MKPKPKPPVVILLHGLGRKASAMEGMAKALGAAGFETWSGDYPSTSVSIEEAAGQLTRQIHEAFPRRRLHAVTHSLGGIVFRHMGKGLVKTKLNWKRAVLIAPPNGGSAVATAFGSNPLFQLLGGPAGQALAGVKATTEEKPWPFPPCYFGVIAGTRGLSLVNPTSWVSGRIFPPNIRHDGTVTVTETMLPGMAELATVDATHTTIVDNLEVQRLTIKFLKEGVFK